VIDYQRIFHTGVRVPDLDAALADYGEGLDITWAAVREVEQSVWTPATGLQELHLKFTYSAEGPQHLELLEGPPGTVWDGREQPGAHHIGVWVDDIKAETDGLIEQGWTLAAAHQDPASGGYGVFTYLQPPTGLIVELVDAAIEPGFEAWWSAALSG
jgi:catechol 2,3-dioxygenase-like lactoylglutathione lyase family enzyme